MAEQLAALLEQGQVVLRLSNKVAPGKRHGLLGFADAFAALRPEVQEAAQTEAAKLDDGAHLEVSRLDGRKKVDGDSVFFFFFFCPFLSSSPLSSLFSSHLLSSRLISSLLVSSSSLLRLFSSA